jgi:geranylgeranyl pyrophosphate synthase
MHPVAGHGVDKLTEIIEERGNRIRQRFGQEVLRGIHDATLLSILQIINEKQRASFRPALTSFSCEAVGGNPQMVDEAGLMFTLVSTGISIHDDIIDKSSRKHLRITILGKFGINKSLLVGDLLIVKGWAMIGDMLKKRQNPAMITNIAQIYRDLCTEMCEAEFMDNCSKKRLHADLEYHKKILWKAMAETEACTRIGATIGNGSDEEIQMLSQFGRRLGFTSRLADEVKDTLNIDGNLAHRLKHESVPLPILFAANSSQDRKSRINSIIKEGELSSSSVRELLEMCFDSGALSFVLRTAQKNMKATQNCLKSIKPSFSREVLLNINKKVFMEITSLVEGII